MRSKAGLGRRQGGPTRALPVPPTRAAMHDHTGEEESMTALGYHQEQGYRLPRIRGWDVSGDIAHTVATDYRRLVDIFGLEPPEPPFPVYVGPAGGGHA